MRARAPGVPPEIPAAPCWLAASGALRRARRRLQYPASCSPMHLTATAFGSPTQTDLQKDLAARNVGPDGRRILELTEAVILVVEILVEDVVDRKAYDAEPLREAIACEGIEQDEAVAPVIQLFGVVGRALDILVHEGAPETRKEAGRVEVAQP